MFSNNKKFKLNEYDKIYLMIPSKVSTGGPEAMHQLGNILQRDLNKKVKIYYLPTDIKDPIHENYKKFSLGFERTIDDHEKNLLIIPEYYNYLLEAKRFNKIKKVIWWLSLDNYLGSKFRFENNKILRSLYKIPFNFIKKFNDFTKFFLVFTLNKIILNFYLDLKTLINLMK